MASINDARKLIYNTFISKWNDRTPFTLDNEKFAEPETAWVRLTVKNTGSQQDTLGRKTKRKFLRQGSIFGQVFAPINQGTLELDNLSKAIRDIFEGERLSNEVWINNSDIREVGPSGKFYMYIVESFFNYQETK